MPPNNKADTHHSREASSEVSLGAIKIENAAVTTSVLASRGER